MAEEFSAETRRLLERANETIAQSRQLATERRALVPECELNLRHRLLNIATLPTDDLERRVRAPEGSGLHPLVAHQVAPRSEEVRSSRHSRPGCST
jgi:hypothetical protein